MITTQQPAIGVFGESIQAQQAINELLQAGFGLSQIRFVERGIPIRVREKIKSLLTGEDISVGRIYKDLVKMGVLPEDALSYQNAFEAGHFIVAVQGTRDIQEAITILIRSGGYSVNQRYALGATHGNGKVVNWSKIRARIMDCK
jgi:hypothetical protein